MRFAANVKPPAESTLAPALALPLTRLLVNVSNANAPSAETPATQEAQWRHRTRHYSPAFQDAYVRYLGQGDASQLPVLAKGLLELHVETVTAEWLAERGDRLNLQTDLGTDSIALAEVAFAAEELFDIKINNEELAQLRTLKDLENFIETKRQA